MARLRLYRLRERPINASAPPAPAAERASGNGAGSRAAASDRSRPRAPASGPAQASTPPSAPGPPTATATAPARAATRKAPAGRPGGGPLAGPPRPRAPVDEELDYAYEPLPLWMTLAGLGVLAAAVVGILFAVGVLGRSDSADDSPAPPIASSATQLEKSAGQTPEDLGFPAFATKNTTRIGGSTAAANAAAAALATFPSTVPDDSPSAVTLVPEGDWRGGIAAASLVAPPLNSPVLISGPGGIPKETAGALSTMTPQGTVATGGSQAFALPGAEVPQGLDTRHVEGGDPAAVAASLMRLRQELVGLAPDHIVIAPEHAPAFAMPAASWAARSGDPVLYADRDSLPEATAKALASQPGTPAYVIGPPSAISPDVLKEIADTSRPVVRISRADPVANSIVFARFADGSFGWNVNDPGHGFVVARSDRPMDAAAAAPLSAAGTWGPLLLTDNATTLPGPLRGYLLDVKPGYENDPTRAFYNHVWVIGDQDAIDTDQQAAIDFAAELTQVNSDQAPTALGAGTP
ncbi:MAG: cell wall-binding repeat-containing protein [Solirubrobacterales bacterium]